MTFYGSKTDVARFAAFLLMYSREDLQWITITIRGSSEDFFVSLVIKESLEGTVKRLAQTYSLQLTDTLSPNIQVG